MLRKEEERGIVIVTDATLSPEEAGAAGISAVLLGDDGQAKLAIGKKVEENDIVAAELRAILYALEEIPKDNTQVTLLSDNSNAVDFLNGDAGTDVEKVDELVKKIKKRAKTRGLAFHVEWQPRSTNGIADAVAAVSARAQSVWART